MSGSALSARPGRQRCFPFPLPGITWKESHAQDRRASRARNRGVWIAMLMCTWLRWGTRWAGCWAPEAFPANAAGYRAALAWMSRMVSWRKSGLRAPAVTAPGRARYLAACGIAVVE